MQQLDERLKGQYASLSPQEQRVADFIFDHFDDLISCNSAGAGAAERRVESHRQPAVQAPRLRQI